jgi:hypothetical protein
MAEKSRVKATATVHRTSITQDPRIFRFSVGALLAFVPNFKFNGVDPPKLGHLAVIGNQRMNVFKINYF